MNNVLCHLNKGGKQLAAGRAVYATDFQLEFHGFGHGGNDKLYGGPGDDFFLGGDGADNLSADTGANTVTGGLGADTLSGDGTLSGDDRVGWRRAVSVSPVAGSGRRPP